MNKTATPHPDQTRLPLPLTSPHQAVRDALLAELLALPFHAFEACIQELLHSLGYTQVQLLGRIAWRQKTRHGGHDLAAASNTGVTSTRVLIQLKQYRRPVSRRFVDELAGCLNRSDAEQGMIIATGSFSRAALKAAQENQIVPVRLVPGEELLDLLIAAQIGVQPTTEWSEWQVDHAYLRDLAQRYPNRVPVYQMGSVKDAPNEKKDITPSGRARLEGGTMLWRTHMLGGISSLWIVEAFPHGLTPELLAPLIVCAALGALLPDLDASEAKIEHLRLGQIEPFAPLSHLLNRRFGHRGFLHSLGGVVALALVTLPIAIWGSWQFAAALLLGYVSHLILDACTRAGITAFPGPQRRFYVLPPRLRIVTGSAAEEIVVAILGSLALLLVLHQLVLLAAS